MTVTCHFPESSMPLTIGRDYRVLEMDRYQSFVVIIDDNGDRTSYPLSVFDNCWS